MNINKGCFILLRCEKINTQLHEKYGYKYFLQHSVLLMLSLTPYKTGGNKLLPILAKSSHVVKKN